MKRIYLWVPVILWMAVIFYFSSHSRITVSQDSMVNFIFFKTLHVLEYAVLYLLLFRAVKYSRRGDREHLWYITAFLITVLYAESDEIHQTFVPTREGRLRDVIIDAGGAVLTWIFLKLYIQKLPVKLRALAKRWLLI